MPLLVTAASGDPLQAHLDRLATSARAHGSGRPPTARPKRSTAARSTCWLHRGDPAPAPVATRPVAGRLWNRMVSTDAKAAALRAEA